jgi:phosphoribosylformylglycinamidine synthase
VTAPSMDAPRPTPPTRARRESRAPLSIMIEGPIGGASFNNEFGRPNLLGYFRTYQQTVGGTVAATTSRS